jgi:hypothetical protein
MAILFQTTWMTLVGMSLLFVGGLVLWVYGTRAPNPVVSDNAPEADATRKFHSDLVQWFLLYGAGAVFAGIGSLITAFVLML